MTHTRIALALIFCMLVVSAHPLNALANNRQANAGARIFIITVQTLEDVEDFLMMLGRNAKAVIAHLNDHSSLFGLPSYRHMQGHRIEPVPTREGRTPECGGHEEQPNMVEA